MASSKLPRIAIVGSRGVPANYGGFETFAEEIAAHLHKNYGYHVTVVCDAEQQQHNNSMAYYLGIELRYSQYAKVRNPIRYYYNSIKLSVVDHDIIYSCGPAGGLFGPMVRRYGKIMMTNPDGLNSKRSKWSWPVKVAFRAFEFAATRFSDRVICDSKGIEEYIRDSYGCHHTDVAEYGAYPNPWLYSVKDTVAVLNEYGLERDAYHLVVSRLEPENNVETIVSGYQLAEHKWPLVVVGNLNETAFVRRLQSISGERVRFVGGIYDKDKLAIVRAHAVSYLHGHSVGGTNPSLLEGMASRNLCICHDNPFNREVVGEHGLYFTDADDVNACLARVEEMPENFVSMRDAVLSRIRDYYNWNHMAEKYHGIFSISWSNTKK